MIKYGHILSYVARTAWAIAPEKIDDLLAVLAFRAAGHTFTPAEIQARIGGDDRRPAEPSKRGAIAVIPIRGVIAHRMGAMDDTSGGTSAERIGAMLDAVAADESIGTIVYDMDTPGGTVPGIQELAAKMFALRGVKKQIAQVNGMAASAGYWLASQADEIVSIPSGSAGSIGVFTVHQDLSKALEAEGIDVSVISAGKFKTEGNPFEPLSEEGRAFIQARVDEAYTQFTKDVARGRGVSVADIKAGYGQGRALGAKAALEAGLIDRIGTFEDTVARIVGRRSSSAMRAEGDVDTLQSAELHHVMAATDDDELRRRFERF